jgi:hypothetical protein
VAILAALALVTQGDVIHIKNHIFSVTSPKLAKAREEKDTFQGNLTDFHSKPK